MPRGKRSDAEIRAAVMAALLLGRPVAEVAREHKLPYTTVKAWAEGMGEELQGARQEVIGDLLSRYLVQGFEALNAITEHLGNPEWLMKQNARDLAKVHEVLFDQMMRTIQMLQASGQDLGFEFGPMEEAPASRQSVVTSNYVS